MITADINQLKLRQEIENLARLQYHKLYEYNMHGPDTFDCAGFVWFVYHEILNINLYEKGIGLSTTTKMMTSMYGNLQLFSENDMDKDLKKLKKGDIVFFHRQSLEDTIPKKDNKYPGHCGIYLNDNYFIHCSRPKGRVIISNFLQNRYWQNVLVASKDIIGDSKVLKITKRYY